MKSTDARGLTHEQLTDMRRRAVAAIQRGESPDDVARVFGVNRSSVYGWLSRYRAGGWDALDAGKRGGRRPKLDAKAMQWVYESVVGTDPRQYRFEFALWTSRMVGELIRTHLGVKLSKASVCRLLNQLGLSAQRPLWRAYQQDRAMVERWMAEVFPAIRERAKREGAQIWFEDEAGVRSDAHAGTTWAPRGHTPVVSSTGARFGINIISAVSQRGDFRFMCVEGRVNASVFLEFLRRLVHNAPCKVFLIVDGHPVHKAKMVRDYVAAVSDWLELFFLPPYAPELNPDELVWNDLKNHAIGRQSIKGPDQLKRAVISFLRYLQRTPDRVRSYFRAPTTRYAAA
jgi:transposase